MSLTSTCHVRRWPFFCRVFIQPTVRHNSTRSKPAWGSEDLIVDANPSKVHRHVPRKTIFSGIQPTGVPHLGNYLGALRQWKELQDEKARGDGNTDNHVLLYAIVDLHALTHQQSPAELLQRRMETFASLLAIGLDPRYTGIFFQSQVQEHCQLMWYLSTVASTGYLSRMTQWKSKLGVSEHATIDDQTAREKLRLGLFSYPVLQAADILLYQATIVPVGEDQQQHVEFARNLARSFNSQYRAANGGIPFFKVPTAKISPAKRIMSLKDPTVKMSKSHPDPNSRILITDTPDDIHRKVKGALTDSIEGVSYDPETRPGVSNLVEILRHVSKNDASCTEIASDISNQSMRAFKEHVAEEITKCLDGFRDRFHEALDDKDGTFTFAQSKGYKIATSTATRTMKQLHMLMGLNRRDARSEAILARRINKASTDEEERQVKKTVVQEEQQREEELQEDEPDVTPQKDQGVDRPIAS